MSENIMILFLSTVKIEEEETVISFPYRYINKNKEIIDVNGIQTNEAAVKTVLHQLNNAKETLSAIYMLCTETVTKKYILDSKKLSYLDFFKNNILNFCKKHTYTPPSFEPIDYIENSTGESTFTPIFKMANKITKSCKFNDTCVYADMTGGMRNSSMLMLSIIRLLEYEGIKVKQVFYSNWLKTTGEEAKSIVNYLPLNNYPPELDADIINHKDKDNSYVNIIDDITDIYELNNLIAGAEEFNKYGSAKILDKYFSRKDKIYSKCLQELIRTMNRFSENIRLCRADKFENAISNLSKKIKDFEDFKNFKDNNDVVNTSNEILLLLLPMIIEKYKVLFNNDKKPKHIQRLEIIRWCTNMDFLQQALTLYVEWVPDYIVEMELLYPESIKLKNDIKDLSEDNNNTQHYIFINAKGLLKEKESIIDYHTNNLKFGNSKSYLNYDKVIEIISTYRKIKDIRNNTNHASDCKKFISYKDIKNLLNKSILELEEATTKYNRRPHYVP